MAARNILTRLLFVSRQAGSDKQTRRFALHKGRRKGGNHHNGPQTDSNRFSPLTHTHTRTLYTRMSAHGRRDTNFLRYSLTDCFQSCLMYSWLRQDNTGSKTAAEACRQTKEYAKQEFIQVLRSNDWGLISVIKR